MQGYSVWTSLLSKPVCVRLHSMSSKSSFPLLVAPVNLSTDLLEAKSLRTTACLRYADHHLNALDAATFLPTDNRNVDLFCVSQACSTYSVADLKKRLQQTRTDDAVIPVVSEMWIESLGNTSMTFGHVIRFEDNLLAAMTRIYVRTNTKTGKMLNVLEKEREDLFPATPSRRDKVKLPVVTKLEAPSESDTMEPLFEVLIGPQHCNNDHVDHAALADFILQGMSLRGMRCTQKLSLRYLSPAKLNQTLKVCVHKVKPLAALYKCGSPDPLVIGQLETPESNESNL